VAETLELPLIGLLFFIRLIRNQATWTVLRVDKKFRTYGSEDQKREYHKRPPIEAVDSFLKTQFSMATNKVRDLGQVATYVLFSVLCLALNREVAQNVGRLRQSSVTNILQHLMMGQGSALSNKRKF